MAISELELTKWRSDIMMENSLGPKFIEQSYFNPKKDFKDSAQTYYIYVQPVVVALLIIWFILVIRALWTEEYMKKFGFMTAYSITDILALVLQNIMMIYSFEQKAGYLRYEMCYVFEIFVTVLPNVLFAFSQWLKVAQSFQRFIICYKPMDYQDYFNRKTVTISIIVLLCSCGGFSSLYIFIIDFQRVITIDKTTKKAFAICRLPYFFSKEKLEIFNYYSKVLDYTFITIALAIPSFLLVAFSIYLILKIRTQNSFQRQNRVERTAADVSADRLVKVVMVTTVLYAVITILGLLWVVLFHLSLIEIFESSVTEYGLFVTNITNIIRIGANFALFSWLSSPFRSKILQAWSKLMKLRKCSREVVNSEAT